MKTIEEKTKMFQEALELIKQELNVDIEMKIDFPEYKVYPADLQLALQVLSKHRMSLILSVKDVPNSESVKI